MNVWERGALRRTVLHHIGTKQPARHRQKGTSEPAEEKAAQGAIDRGGKMRIIIIKEQKRAGRQRRNEAGL